MGHRLITALIFLNVMGFLACVALIAAAISKDDPVVLAQVTNSVFVSVRMFVVGAAVPTVAWGIAALEFDRSHTKKRLLTSATMYALLDIVLRCRMAPSASIPREPANHNRIQRRSLTLAVPDGKRTRETQQRQGALATAQLSRSATPLSLPKIPSGLQTSFAVLR